MAVFIRACSLTQCQPALHACLHTSSVECAHICTVHTVAHTDISTSWHFAASLPWDSWAQGTVGEGLLLCVAYVAAAGWLTSSLQEETVSNWLWFGPGSGHQFWPTALLCRDHRLWRNGCGTLGAGAGNRRRGVLWEQRVCVHWGTYTCPLRVRISRTQWHSLV